VAWWWYDNSLGWQRESAMLMQLNTSCWCHV
jgi:hypothetical protein